MISNLRQDLAHVLWIGGAPDVGKSSVARLLAERHDLQVYHYDRRDLAHHQQLALSDPAYRLLLEASLDQRWVQPEPEALFRSLMRSFCDRFHLVLQDLLALPRGRGVIAEGFGLLPDLLAPLLASPLQAIWLAPSDAFKRESMARRGKPSFAAQVSDPARATANLLQRDRLLTQAILEQTRRHGFTLLEVDGARSLEQVAGWVEEYFFG